MSGRCRRLDDATIGFRHLQLAWLIVIFSPAGI